MMFAALTSSQDSQIFSFMKNELITLSAKLLELHKELLTYQTKLVENEDGRKYNSFDLWNLTTQDPRFAWLRQLSGIIIQIDIAVSEKDKSKSVEPEFLFKSVQALFNAQDSDFAMNYQKALLADPTLTIYDVEVRKILKA